MELKHIELANLCVSSVNMRGRGKAVDLANILPSVRARGILVPLIVRAMPCREPVEGGTADTYEIVAGRRRYHAALAVAEEAGGIEPLPCAVLAAGDDADALEASLIENLARLDPDEVTRWESFVRLVREGRSVEEIALTFGLTELQVKRTLALGNLLPRIRNLYRRGEIDVATVRHLTLASKGQQREWLALLDDERAHVPCGSALKAWLFGGISIPVTVALFDLASYAGEIVSDLFGDERWFADAASFWTAQNAAIDERVVGFEAAGWSQVIVLPQGEPFHHWEHERTPKRKGGKVFVVVGQRGDVAFHEGYLSTREARRIAKGDEPSLKPVRPELTSAMTNYVDLHRHAVVRASLATRPMLALRVMVAHAIAGSPLWSVRVEPQRAVSPAIAESVETCASEVAFDERRRAVLALLGFDPEFPTVTHDNERGMVDLLARLAELPDAAVLDIITIVMGETLAAGGPLIDTLGVMLDVDMSAAWRADDALLDLIRNKATLGSILAEVAGEQVAAANARETGKVKRGIIRDCLSGSNGRTKVEGWTPRWLRFPATTYVAPGGAEVIALPAPVMPQPLAQAA